jgi:phosphoglycerate dehydrogenase-like enzyme
MPKILLTNYYKPEPLSFVNKLVPDGFEIIALERPGQEELISKASQADYLLAGGRTRVDQKVLEAAPKLKMIQRSGVGLDSLDLVAIEKKGIPVYVNEGVNERSVAEHTILLILACMRKLVEVNSMTHKGHWVKHDLGISCHDLYGKQIGLIGLGSIGSRVAKMLAGFGVNLVYFKRTPLSNEQEKQIGASYRPLIELLSTSDVISVHSSLNTDSSNLLGSDEFKLLKKGSVIINTSRGGVVDEESLFLALKSGQVASAGLDVFAMEPLTLNHPLLGLDNVVLTPHIASITAETFADMIGSAMSSIALFDKGNQSQIKAKRII